MKCASTPRTAALIQGLRATPMCRPLWLNGSRSYRLPHCIVSESTTHWPAVSICVLPLAFRHPECTQFPKSKFVRHNFVKKWPWNLSKMQGKWRNGESSVLSDLLINCTHQIFIHHRRSAAPRIIMHIIASFIKQSHPSPYHWTTHGMFCIHVTKLTMNFSRFHVLRIQETDYSPHFTCGGILYFLTHYKHTARYINTVQISANCVRALTKNQKSRHACAPSWPQRCSGNIRKRNLLSG